MIDFKSMFKSLNMKTRESYLYDITLFKMRMITKLIIVEVVVMRRLVNVFEY